MSSLYTNTPNQTALTPPITSELCGEIIRLFTLARKCPVFLKKSQHYHIYEYYVMILLDILKFLTIDVETDPLANCRRHFVAAEKNKIKIR